MAATQSMARRAYDSLGFTELDLRVGSMIEKEVELTKAHTKIFGSPYLDFDTFAYQATSVFLHLTKLVKHVVLLLGTLLLAAAALLNDWSVARDLGMMAAGRALLVAINLISMVTAFASIFVNSISLLSYKMAGHQLKEENLPYTRLKYLPKDQGNLRIHIQNGFFSSVKESLSNTETALDDVVDNFKSLFQAAPGSAL